MVIVEAFFVTFGFMMTSTGIVLLISVGAATLALIVSRTFLSVNAWVVVGKLMSVIIFSLASVFSRA